MEKFIKRWLWRILSLFIGIILAYQVWILGHVVFWNFYDPTTSAFMQARLDVCDKKILLQYCVHNGYRTSEFLTI